MKKYSIISVLLVAIMLAFSFTASANVPGTRESVGTGMISKDIYLWDKNLGVYMQAFIQKNSNEFQTNIKRPTVLIMPGGAYLVTTDREAEAVALNFMSKGYNAFVLRYSIQRNAKMPQPILDGFKAISVIRSNAKEWNVDPNKIVAVGFSAGGHVAASVATMWNQPEFATELGTTIDQIKPNAVVLGYPLLQLGKAEQPWIIEAPASAYEDLRSFFDKDLVELNNSTKMAQVNMSQQFDRYLFGTTFPTDEQYKKYSPVSHVSKDTAPSFIWTTAADEQINVTGAITYVQKMYDAKNKVEFHMFENGVHGLSLATAQTDDGTGKFINDAAAKWFDMAITWLNATLGK